ncbi:MAG: DNA repair protein RecO [Candidatus Berkelbacteria bacterium]|nr:DNA repair protein RecO [Candidatus Berkelbacteria bacterium]
MQIKTSGIIIKRMNFGEADRILTVLTHDHGKVKAIARGSRKILAKLGGSLEPFCLVDFIFHEGKSFYVVTSAVVINHFEKIHTDIDKIAKAFYIGELLDKSLEDHQNHPEVYELFKKYLENLEGADDPILIPVFSAKILESLGFKPEVFECLHCRQKLSLAQNFWDDIEGGVICQSCHDKFGHGRKIENDLIKILRLIFSPTFAVGSKINISEKYKNQTAEILENYVEVILERELKSKKFLDQISSSSK